MYKDIENDINSLLNYLKKLKNSSKLTDTKMYSGLCSWIKSYVGYMEYNNKFNPSNLLKYERGEILYVNLGYNIGSEERQPHYVVVVENNNDMASPVVTVVPLTSVKDKSESEINKNNLFIGTEVYDKLMSKHKQLQVDSENQLEEIMERLSTNIDKLNNIKKNVDLFNHRLEEEKIKGNEEQIRIINLEMNQARGEMDEVAKECSELNSLAKNVKAKIDANKNVKNRIRKMKNGSIVLVNQITTISKLKIYDPKNRIDSLYGIKLEPDTMDEINNKIKKMFIH